MLPREEAYIREWEFKRGKGKWTYVILTSVIWGTLFPVTITAFRLAVKGSLYLKNLWDSFSNSAFLKYWGGFVVFFFFFALFMWSLAYNKYKEFKRRQREEQEANKDNVL